MRSRYIVSYDICEPERLRRVYNAMRGFGDHLQYSVFRCDLTDVERIEMIGVLGEIINFAEDQVLIIDIGPADGRGASCISSVGRPYTNPDRHAIVV
jgi:CRISPR-associated protein Cas2